MCRQFFVTGADTGIFRIPSSRRHCSRTRPGAGLNTTSEASGLGCDPRLDLRNADRVGAVCSASTPWRWPPQADPTAELTRPIYFRAMAARELSNWAHAHGRMRLRSLAPRYDFTGGGASLGAMLECWAAEYQSDLAPLALPIPVLVVGACVSNINAFCSRQGDPGPAWRCGLGGNVVIQLPAWKNWRWKPSPDAATSAYTVPGTAHRSAHDVARTSTTA